MDTNRLRQFCTIVETGSLRKAAELLHISHSGLSKSMKVLENDMGFPLFAPSGRGIAISDRGLKLYGRASSFFTELERLLGATEERDVVRIGSFEVFTSYFMGKLIHDFLPQINLEVHELVPGRLEEALSLNRIDLGITYEPIPRPGIEYVKVNALTMGAYVLKGKFAHSDILEIPFVVPVNPLEGAPSGVKGLDGWPDERFRRLVRYRVDLMATGIELVKRGLCAIFIPDFVANLYNDSALERFKIESVPLPKRMGAVRRDVYIVKRESTEENATIKQIARALRNSL